MAASISSVGSNQAASGVTTLAVSSYTIGSSQPVFVGVFVRASASSPSLSDLTNTYSLSSTTTTSGGGKLFLFVCLNPTAVTGGTLTASWTNTGAASILACQGAGFVSPSSDSANPMTGAAQTLTAGSLSNSISFPNGHPGATLGSANATLIGLAAVDNVLSSSAWAEDATNGWTAGGSSTQPSNGTMVHMAYQNVTATTAVPYKPAFGSTDSTHLWASQEYAVDTAAAPNNHHRLMMMGVG